ncbi:MAG: hypothetical protein JOZ47_23355 [Kutzneria sp.]|nr:hypothetical protein [Kutzneria sp.]
MHKHAGGARTEVTLRFLADSLDVSVVNDAPPLTIDAGLPSGGHGLTGLRERMALLGGEFRSGPRPGGGFEMTAMIKIAESCR